MADQVEIYNVNKTLLSEDAYNVNIIKEEHREDDLAAENIYISETGISMDSAELQDQVTRDDIKQYSESTNLDNIKAEFSSPEIGYGTIHDNFEIEEKVNANNVKIELLLYCEDCQVYYEDYCVNCGMLVHILSKTGPINVDNKSREKLPNERIVEIRNCFGEFHVFALKSIPAGVRFGPFTGINATECVWKIKGGKFLVEHNTSTYLNWMQYINPTKNINEQNLRVFQYEHNLYYESTRKIAEGDELLVHFGEEHEDSLNRNEEIDFIPTKEHIFKDTFACTFCCLGFSSKLYLARHKTICPENAAGEFSIEELMQCPYCRIHLDQKEYSKHDWGLCCGDRKSILPAIDNGAKPLNGRKTQARLIYKCQRCEEGLESRTNQHCQVEQYKCEICCGRFKTKEVQGLHVDNTHTFAGGEQDETKKFKCSLCEFQTKYNMNLKRHIKAKHSREFKYKCETCDYKSNFKLHLKIHIDTEHLKTFKHKCDSCNYETNLKDDFETHLELKHEELLKYKCDSCDYKAYLKSYLTKHIDTTHSTEFKHKCDSCEYKTNRKDSLEAHVKSKHLNEFKYKCDTCDYKTTLKSELKKHIDAMHLKEFKYKCDRCDYKANRKRNFEAHVESKHLKEFKYKCDTCDYKTVSKWNLKKHRETRHLKVFKYKCTTRDYTANKEDSSKVNHSREFKYKCETCDYKANFKCHLKKHTDTVHLKKFKYNCDRCDYKTNHKGNLDLHVESKHLKLFKYKCDSCDYKANLKSNVKAHMDAIHLKKFKHNCDRCDYKTNRKDSFEAHVESKHLNECDYKTIWKSELKEHADAMHLKEFNTFTPARTIDGPH